MILDVVFPTQSGFYDSPRNALTRPLQRSFYDYSPRSSIHPASCPPSVGSCAWKSRKNMSDSGWIFMSKYICKTKYTLHCIALPHSCTVWRVRLHLRLPVTLHLPYMFLFCLNLCAIHACHNYENVWQSIRCKTHMRFTSRSYTKNQWVSPSFRHKMRSGRDFAAIGCDQTDRFGQGWNSLLTYSVARLLFGFGKHRTLSLKLEPSRAFQWAKTPGTGMEEVGIGGTSRDAPQPRPQHLLERLLICSEWTAGSASKTAHIA